MRILVIVLTLGLLWSSTMVNAGVATFTVGLVNIQKVLTSISDGQAVRKKLEGDFKKKQVSLKKEEEKFKKLQTKFEKQRSVLNETAKISKEKELRDLYISIQEKTMKFQQELQALERELKQPLIKKIKEVVEKISKQYKVAITFPTETTPLYVENSKDLTEATIKAYNKKYPLKKKK